MENCLSNDERTILLNLARQALLRAANREEITALDLSGLPEKLQQPGASFVTLTKHGQLRGCIGALTPKMPLAEDVREHAVAAATQDYRFKPVQASELKDIVIEISCLTLPEDLIYQSADELMNFIRPEVDGVTIMDGFRRATFLPQVWHKIPSPADFLDHLCQKMGAQPDLWRRKILQVQTYQVEEFHE